MTLLLRNVNCLEGNLRLTKIGEPGILKLNYKDVTTACDEALTGCKDAQPAADGSAHRVLCQAKGSFDSAELEEPFAWQMGRTALKLMYGVVV